MAPNRRPRVDGRSRLLPYRGSSKGHDHPRRREHLPARDEQRLFTHAAVGDVAVVGIPDERWGEQVCAFVRTAPGALPEKEELDAYVRAELAAYKAPRIWVFVDEFPMTPSGKVQKFVLRDRFAAGELPPV